MLLKDKQNKLTTATTTTTTILIIKHRLSDNLPFRNKNIKVRKITSLYRFAD